MGAVHPILSDISFFQIRLDGKVIAPMSDDARILMRGSAAYNSTRNEKLPVSLRLFAGGNESIRGYSFESFPGQGVGRYLYTGSLEIQQRLYHEWYGAIFYDFGDVIADSPAETKLSVGAGIVRATPIGTIEIGLAHPFNDKNKSVRFVFSIGPDL